MDREVHRVIGSFEESRDLVRLAVAVGVFEHADAIVLRAVVLRGPEVRVALDDEKPALRVEVERDRMDDVRRRGEEFDHQPRIGRHWDVERLCRRRVVVVAANS